MSASDQGDAAESGELVDGGDADDLLAVLEGEDLQTFQRRKLRELVSCSLMIVETQQAERPVTSYELRVPVPEDAPHHSSTDTIVLDGNVLLTSWVEGRSSYRLGILDLQTGKWQVMAGLRGMLRDALALPGERAVVLTDYALTDIDWATGTIVRQLTAKIGKHNSYLSREDGDAIAVGNSVATMETLVSLTDLTVLKRRRRRPPPAVAIPTDAQRAGAARVLAVANGVVVAATESRATAPQRLLILSANDHSDIGTVAFPNGVECAHVFAGGVIAAAPDIGRARTLVAIPGAVSLPDGSTALTLDALVPVANESAASLLHARAKKNPPRTVFRGVRLEPGEALSDFTVRRITLFHCSAARADLHHERPRISRVHVTDLELQGSSPGGSILEDVTIDGLRCPEGSGFWFGCEFRRVTLKGRIRGLILNPDYHGHDDAEAARYELWHRERMDDPEWMLDLTEATGDITIRGYPSRFIRRNPELHAVVTAEAARTLDWRSIDPGRSALYVSLQELANSDWEDVTLIADTHGARADADLRYIQQLRALGIARPD